MTEIQQFCGMLLVSKFKTNFELDLILQEDNEISYRLVKVSGFV